MTYIKKNSFIRLILCLALIVSFTVASTVTFAEEPPKAEATAVAETAAPVANDASVPYFTMAALINYTFNYGQSFNIKEIEDETLVNQGIGFDIYFKRTAKAFGSMNMNLGFLFSFNNTLDSTNAEYSENGVKVLQADIVEGYNFQFGGFIGASPAAGLDLNIELAAGPSWTTIEYIGTDIGQSPNITRGSGFNGKFGLGVLYSPMAMGDMKILTKLGLYYVFGDNIPLAEGLNTASNGNQWGIYGKSFMFTLGFGIEL